MLNLPAVKHPLQGRFSLDSKRRKATFPCTTVVIETRRQEGSNSVQPIHEPQLRTGCISLNKWRFSYARRLLGSTLEREQITRYHKSSPINRASTRFQKTTSNVAIFGLNALSVT